MRISHGKIVVVALLGLALGACSKSGNLSVSAASSRSAALTAGATPGTLDLGQGILVSRVRIAVRKVALEGATAATGAGSCTSLAADHGSPDCEREGADEDGEVKVGPFLVDLSGDAMTAGTVSFVLDAQVPPGTYHELKLVVGPVSPERAGSDAVLAAMNGRSVVVDGTVDGAPFAFSAAVNAVQEREGDLTVDASTTRNVTLSFDPSGWFRSPTGARLDPNDAAAAEQIARNIGASLRALEDDDHDGQDDRDEGHAGGHR